MKLYRMIIDIAIAVTLVGATVTFFYLWKFERAERIRTGQNQHALLTDIKHYKTADSLNAVSVEQLTLSAKELKEHESDLVNRLKDLNIKLKRVESFTSVSTETKIEFVPTRKDSIIYLPGKDSVIRLKCLEYKDAWTDFTGCYDENNIPRVTLTTRDSIDIIGHIVPKKFLFIRHGIKSINAEIINHNPNSRITHGKVIKIKK